MHAPLSILVALSVLFAAASNVLASAVLPRASGTPSSCTYSCPLTDGNNYPLYSTQVVSSGTQILCTYNLKAALKSECYYSKSTGAYVSTAFGSCPTTSVSTCVSKKRSPLDEIVAARSKNVVREQKRRMQPDEATA